MQQSSSPTIRTIPCVSVSVFVGSVYKNNDIYIKKHHHKGEFEVE